LTPNTYRTWTWWRTSRVTRLKMSGRTTPRSCHHGIDGRQRGHLADKAPMLRHGSVAAAFGADTGAHLARLRVICLGCLGRPHWAVGMVLLCLVETDGLVKSKSPVVRLGRTHWSRAASRRGSHAAQLSGSARRRRWWRAPIAATVFFCIGSSHGDRLRRAPAAGMLARLVAGRVVVPYSPRQRHRKACARAAVARASSANNWLGGASTGRGSLGKRHLTWGSWRSVAARCQNRDF